MRKLRDIAVPRSNRYFLLLLVAVGASACSQFRDMHRQDDPGLYSGQRPEAEETQQAARQSGSSTGTEFADTVPEPETRIRPGPPGFTPAQDVAMTASDDFVPDLVGDDIAGSYNSIPLPAFINTVFGEQLGLPYSLDSSVASQPDLVTLRLTEPVSPTELFLIARRTLMDYGVGMRSEQGVYVFTVDRNTAASDVPILVTGRALPEVPESHRPVFVFVPLNVVQQNRVTGWLKNALHGKELEILEDPTRNAVILRGKPAIVEQALAMIDLLDRPNMRGKYSANVQPAYAKVDALAIDLVEILKSEGYDASRRAPIGAVIVLPLTSVNQLVIFAPSQEVLDHVADWVKIIDQRQQLAVDDGIFSYEVNNTQASYIAELMNSLRAGGAAEEGAVQGVAGGAAGRRPTSFVVDSNRNAIIFRGSGKEWSQLLPVIEQMDQLAPSVLVEVLLAEVALTDTDNSSFQFLENTMVGDFGLSYGTLGLIGGERAAFSATLDKAGETRAVLKLLYENRRAEIRSRPRLMVKSGQTAAIDVGDEIPVLASSSQSTQNPDAPIVNDVVYRNTGVRLEIRPVVHSSGYVDIEVVQELSEAEVNDTSGIDSPTIRNRRIETTVTLRDGGSILLGGLISNTSSDVETGVPFLGAVPGVGRLFRSDGETEDRRELLIMIIPYVMDTPRDAESITDVLTNSLAVQGSAEAAPN